MRTLVFAGATLAALILRQPFYDTQCGAKLFRNTPALAGALSEPFRSPWAFDLELLGRLREALPGRCREHRAGEHRCQGNQACATKSLHFRLL